MTATARLTSLHAALSALPNRGASLGVDTTGRVSNGISVVATLPTRGAALRALKEAGFHLHGNRWYTYA